MACSDPNGESPHDHSNNIFAIAHIIVARVTNQTIVTSMSRKPTTQLRRGWTTGACATAAVKAALDALWGNGFGRDVTITLPKGETPKFPLAFNEQGDGWAKVGITKDAGDDPDVTHGALIVAHVRTHGSQIEFKAGEGVGTVTKAGLPIGVGEPAINPVPRQMMTDVVNAQAEKYNQNPYVTITISIPGGDEIALKTWNGRLGIVGGLSILGTTGVVRPFSCAAWIASIHRGVDVARANGTPHVAGCTGATSERVVQELYGLSDYAMLDMGDFSGGLLKYIAKNPVPRLTIGGGIGKIVKLAQGAVDLHSSRSQVDFDALNTWSDVDIRDANTALEAVERAGNTLATRVAQQAHKRVMTQLKGADIAVDIVVIDRAGRILGRAQ
jgi:cobalt-precorrin-5B (C1)-methyltransferase